jgi:hypothetical protein
MPGQSSSTTAEQSTPTITRRPRNRGRLIGQKPPLKLREVWAIRTRLQLADRMRDLALFNVATDSKLRGGDIVALRVDDVELSGHVRPRSNVLQKKTGPPTQFEIMEQTRSAVQDWIARAGRKPGDYLFPSRVRKDKPLGIRHYARLVDGRVGEFDRVGPDSLWYALPAPDEGSADLPADRQSSSRAAPAGSHQAGEHGALSGHRGGRRPGPRGADRHLMAPGGRYSRPRPLAVTGPSRRSAPRCVRVCADMAPVNVQSCSHCGRSDTPVGVGSFRTCLS